MNNIYKLKFNRNLEQLVVVSEIATNATSGTAQQVLDLSADPQTTSSYIQPVAPNHPLNLCESLLKAGFFVASGISLAAMGIMPAQAITGAQVIAGQALIEQSGSVTTIKNSPNTIIDWQSFNIAKGDLVQFIQESSNSAVLNRVLGNQVSTILGTLKSNGQVFLINPNGILFGKSAVVDTQSLIASTLNMTNEDFLQGNYVFNQAKDQAIASVLNQGLLKVNSDGKLALVGGNVVNAGVLEARQGEVFLLAGQSIQISDLNNPLISYKVTAGNKAINLGEIIGGNVHMLANNVASGILSGDAQEFAKYADQQLQSRIAATGEVELFAGSVSDQVQNNQQTAAQVVGERTGQVQVGDTIIDVSNTTGKAGIVKILGDKVQLLNGTTINASGNTGGYVNIGGDLEGKGLLKTAQSTEVAKDVLVSVAATSGDAGTAIVWGDTAEVDGSFNITSNKGEGGFLETSGHTIDIKDSFKLISHPSIGNSNATQGTWLLDPDVLYVTEGKTQGLYRFLNRGTTGTGDNNPQIANSNATFGSLPKGQNSVVYSGKVLEHLRNYNVVLQAEEAIIFDEASLTYEGDHSLTLKSDVAFFYKSSITLSHLALNLQAKAPRITNLQLGVDSLNIIDSKVDITGLNPSISTSGGLNINNSTVNWLAFGVNLEEQNFDFKRLTVTRNSTFTVGSTLRIPRNAVNGGVGLYGAYFINVTNNSKLIIDGKKLRDWDQNNRNHGIGGSGWNVLILATLGDLTFSENVNNKVNINILNSELTTQGNFSIQNHLKPISGGSSSTGDVTIFKSNISVGKRIWFKFNDVNITQSNVSSFGVGCISATNEVKFDTSNVTFKGNPDAFSDSEHIINGKTIKFTNSNVTVPGVKKNLFIGNKDTKVSATLDVSGSNVTSSTGLWIETQGGNVNFTNSNFAVNDQDQPFRLILGEAKFDKSRLTAEGVINTTAVNLQINSTNITSTVKSFSTQTQALNITNSNITASDLINIELKHGGSEYKIVNSNLTVGVGKLLVCSSDFTGTDMLLVNNANLSGQPVNISLINGGINLTKVAVAGRGFTVAQTNGGELIVDKSVVEVQQEIDFTRGGSDDKGYVFKDTKLKGRGVSVSGGGANTDKAQALFTNSTIEAESKATFGGTRTLVNAASSITGKTGVDILGTNLKVSEKVKLLSAEGYVNLGNQTTQLVETYSTTLTAGSEGKKTDPNTAHDVTMCGTKVVVNNTKVYAQRDVNISAGTGGLTLQNKSNLYAERSYNITGGSITLDKTNLVSVNANYSGHLEATASDFTVSGSEFQAKEKITVKASGNLIVDKKATISSKNTYVESVAGKVELQKGSSVIATEGEVGITAHQGNVVIDDATVTGDQQVSIKALSGTGTIQVTNSTVTSNKSEVYFKGTGDVTLKDGAKATGNSVNLTSDSKVILQNGSQAVTNVPYDPMKPFASGKVDISGTTGIELEGNSKAEAGAVTLTASNGIVKLTDSVVKATGQGLNINGNKGVALDNASATSKLGLIMNANDGTVSLTNSSTISSQDVSVSVSAKNITSKVNSTISGTNAVTLTATENVDLTNATVTSKRNTATISGTNGVTLSNVTLTGMTGAKVESSAGLITLKDKSSVKTTTSGEASVIGASVDLQKDTQVIGHSGATVQATGTTATTGTLKASEAVICATQDVATVTVTATKDITLSTTCVTAKAGANVTSTGGKTTVSGGIVNSEKGEAKVVGQTGVELNTDAQLTGKNATVTSAAGKVTFKDGSDLSTTGTGPDGKATVTGQAVDIQANTEINGTTTTVSSIAGTIDIDNAKIKGSTEVTVSSTGGLATVKNGAVLEAPKASLKSTDNSVLLQGAYVNATTGEALVQGQIDVTVEAGAKVTSTSGAATVIASSGDAKVINSQVEASKTGKASIKAGDEVTLQQAYITGKEITVEGGVVNIEQASKLNSTDKLEVTTTTGKLKVDGGSTLDSKAVTLTGKTEVEVKDSTVNATQDLAITAGTDLTVNNSKLHSTNGNVQLTATAGKVELNNNANVTAVGTATVIANAGDFKATGAQITAKQFTASSATTHVETGTSIAATDGVKVSATGASSIVGATIKNTGSGKVELGSTAGKATIENSKVESQGAIEVRGTDIEIVGTNATAISNEISIGDDKTTGKVEVRNSNFTTGKGHAETNLNAPLDINFRAGTEVTVLGSNIDAARDANFSSPQGTVHLGSSCVSQARDVNITAQNLWLDDMDIISKNDIDFTFNGWVQVTNGSKIESEKNVTLAGKRYLNITNTVVNGTATTLKSEAGFVNTDHASLIARTGTLTVDAKTNALFNHTSVTGQKLDIKVQDGDLRIKGNSTVTSPESITLKADKGTLEVSASRVETTGQATTITMSGKNVVLGNGTNISAKSDITVTATEDIKARGTNITTDGAVGITATRDILLDNTNISGKTLTASSTGGDLSATTSHFNISDKVEIKTTGTDKVVKLNNTTVTSKDSTLTVSGKGGVNLGNGTILCASKKVDVNTEGKLTAVGSNLTSTTADVALKAGSDLSLTNTNISAKTQLDVTSTGGDLSATSSQLSSPEAITVKAEGADKTVTLNNTTVTSTGSTLTVSGKGGVNLGNGTILCASQKVDVKTDGKLVAEGANLTSTTAEVELTAKGDVSLTNTNISGKTATSVTSEATLSATGAAITAEGTTAKLKGTGVTLSDSTVTAPQEVNVTATAGKVTVNDSKLTSADATDTTKGKVVVSGAQDVSFTNGSVVANTDVLVTSSGASVSLNNLTATATNGKLGVTAQKDINLGNGTILTGKTSVDLTATKGNLTSVGSNLSSSNSVNLKAHQNLTLTNTNISGTKATLESETANATVQGGAGAGLITVSEDLTVKGKNVILGKGLVADVTGNVTLVASQTTGQAGSVIANDAQLSAGKIMNVTAGHDITLQNTALSGKEQIKLEAKDNVVLNNSSARSENGPASLKGNAVTLGNGTNVSGTSVAVEATGGDLTAVGSNITTAGDVTLKAQQKVALTNTNVSGKEMTVTSTAENVELTGGKLTPTGNVSIEASATDGSVTISGTQVAATGNVSVTAGKDVTVTGHASISTAQNLTISAGNAVTIHNSTATAQREVEILSKGEQGGKASITNSTVTATNGILNVTANSINLGNGTKLSGKESVTLNATNGDLISVGSNITSENNVTLKATNEVSLTNTNVSGSNVDVFSPHTIKGEKAQIHATEKLNITATNSVTLVNSSVAGDVSVDISATGSTGTVTLNNTTATSKDGSLKVTAPQDINLGNGTKLSAKTDVTLDAGQKITAVGSNITSTEGDVELKAKDKISLTNTNVSGKDVVVNTTAGAVEITSGSIHATNSTTVVAQGDITLQNTQVAGDNLVNLAGKANVNLNNSSVTSSNGAIEVDAGQNLNLGNGTKLSAQTDVTLNAGQAITAVGSNITSTNGKVDLHAKTDISLTNTNISGNKVQVSAERDTKLDNSTIHATDSVLVTAGGNVTTQDSIIKGDASVNVTATGNLVVNNSTVESSAGQVDLNAGKDVILGNGTNVTAQNNVNVNAGGNIAATGTNITSTSGDVKLQANDNITLTNTNISGKDVTVTAVNGSVTTSDSLFNATHDITITAGQEVTLTGTNISATNDVNLKAGGNMTLDGSSIDAGGVVDLNATDGLTAQNSNLSGQGGVSMVAENITLNNSSIKASDGMVDISANKNVWLGNGTNVTGKGEVNIQASQGNITAVGTNITSEGEVKLHAKQNITLTNTNISGNKVAVDSGADTKLDNSSIHAIDSVLVTAGGNVTTQDSTIKGDASVNVTATGNLVVNNSTVESSAGSVDLNAGKDVILGNGTNVTAQNNVNVNAGGNIAATGTNITTTTGEVNLHAKQNITLTNTNISGNKVVVDSGADTNLDNSTIHTADSVLVTAGGNVTTQDSTIKGDTSVNVTATGNLVVNNSTVESSAGSVDLNAGKDVILGNGTNVTAQDNVNVNAGGNISATGTNITTTTGDVNLHAKENITLTNTNISGNKVVVDSGADTKLDNSTIHGKDKVTVNAGGNVTSQDSTIKGDAGVNVSATGDLVVNNSTVESSAGSVDLNAGKDVILGNGTNVTAQDNVNVNAGGNISATGTNITTTTGDVNLHAKQNITLTNTNISGNKVVVDSGADTTLDNSTIHGKDTVTVVAGGNVTSQDSTIKGDAGVNLSATENVVINNSTVESSAGSVDLNAGRDVILGNGTNVTAQENVNITAGGNITAEGTNITSNTADVNLVAKENITLNNTNISGKDVNVNAGNNVTITNSTINSGDNTNITGGGHVEINNMTGNSGHNTSISGNTVNITGSNLTGENIHISAEEDLNGYNNTFIVDDTLGFTSNNGKIDLEGNYGEGNTLELNAPHSGALRDVNNEWHFKRRVVKLQRNDDVLLPLMPEGLLDFTTDEIVRDYGRDYEFWDRLGFAFGEEGDNPQPLDAETAPQGNSAGVHTSASVKLAHANASYNVILETCSVEAQALLAEHQVTATDFLELTLTELATKYHLRAEDVELLDQACVAGNTQWKTRSLRTYFSQLQAQASSR